MKQIIPLLVVSLLLVNCNSVPTQEEEQTQKDTIETFQSTKRMKYSPDLVESIEKAKGLKGQIDEERKVQLEELASYIKEQQEKDEATHLKFICTHNSRRSQLAQIWAAVAADYHGIASVSTSSGGTEATAFNPRAVEALRNAGFHIEQEEASKNPHYRVYVSQQAEQNWLTFSKTYEEGNQSPFMAVMVCSDADKKCPLVPGAQARLAIPYVDPKISDDTPEEIATYAERSFQIASEMFYVMERAKG